MCVYRIIYIIISQIHNQCHKNKTKLKLGTASDVSPTTKPWMSLQREKQTVLVRLVRFSWRRTGWPAGCDMLVFQWGGRWQRQQPACCRLAHGAQTDTSKVQDRWIRTTPAELLRRARLSSPFSPCLDHRVQRTGGCLYWVSLIAVIVLGCRNFQ